MSLKGFHIVFVTVSTLLFLFLSTWSFGFAPESSVTITTLGVISIMGAIIMPIYGICFYRKITRCHL
jgi:hypothetical protein